MTLVVARLCSSCNFSKNSARMNSVIFTLESFFLLRCVLDETRKITAQSGAGINSVLDRKITAKNIWGIHGAASFGEKWQVALDFELWAFPLRAAGSFGPDIGMGLGKGMRRMRNRWRKAPFHWTRERHSVNEDFGEESTGKAGQCRGRGHSVNRRTSLNKEARLLHFLFFCKRQCYLGTMSSNAPNAMIARLK